MYCLRVGSSAKFITSLVETLAISRNVWTKPVIIRFGKSEDLAKFSIARESLFPQNLTFPNGVCESLSPRKFLTMK